jgi:hypothetical protein
MFNNSYLSLDSMAKLELLPKKDILGQKHQMVKGLNNNVIYVGLAGLIGVGGLYYASTAGLLQIPGLSNASTVLVTAFPPQVKTGESVNIEGDFKDSGGRAATVLNGYIAVFEDTGGKVYDGSLGFMVSHFKVSVPTANWRDGSYTAIASDQPITAPGLGGGPTAVSNAPPGVAGPGMGSGTEVTLT